MKWFNTKEKLPDNQQEVLVRKSGLVSLAKFDRPAGKFNLRDGTTLPMNGDQVEWTELIGPGEKK